jgi:hypothetical protein
VKESGRTIPRSTGHSGISGNGKIAGKLVEAALDFVRSSLAGKNYFPFAPDFQISAPLARIVFSCPTAIGPTAHDPV